jgi:hypothetical protein
VVLRGCKKKKIKKTMGKGCHVSVFRERQREGEREREREREEMERESET